MAKHEIIIHENTGATSTSAPYLGSYVSKETVKTAAFVHALAEQSGLPAIQVQAILAGSFDAISALEKDALVRVNLDGGAIAGRISGSFPTSDAAFDPDRNALVLAFHLDEDIRLTLADVTPTIVTDETVTKVRVDNVMDHETPRPYELIHGKHTFDVTGMNIVLTDTGASAKLVNASGQTFPCTVVETVSKQLVRLKSATLLEAGDYKLVITSRGGDSEGPLQTAFRKVKYLKVLDPIAQTTDGTVKIMTLLDNGQSELFTDDHVYDGTSVGLLANPASGWAYTSAILDLGNTLTANATLTPSADGRTFTLRRATTALVDPGTYPAAKFKLTLTKVGTTETEVLELPVKYYSPE